MQVLKAIIFKDAIISLYLCKHFFVVMRKYPDEVQWSSLSKLYRESPFFSLDPIDEEREEEFVMESVVEVDGESVVEVDGVDTNSESAGISTVSIDVGDEDEVNEQHTFSTKDASSTLNKCLEVLRELNTLTRLSKADTTVAGEVLTLLNQAKEKLAGTIPKENGIYLNPTPSTSTWKRKKSQAGPKLDPLPKKRKRDKKAVGGKADVLKKGLPILDQKRAKCESNVVEEPILLDCNLLTNQEEFTDNQVNTVSYINRVVCDRFFYF